MIRLQECICSRQQRKFNKPSNRCPFPHNMRQAKKVVPLETFLMTDQPPTCPKCGRRVKIIAGITTNKQTCKCPGCGFKYKLEEDEE